MNGEMWNKEAGVRIYRYHMVINPSYGCFDFSSNFNDKLSITKEMLILVVENGFDYVRREM